MVKVQAPVLMFHGLKDTALNAKRFEQHLGMAGQRFFTLVTVPQAGHFVQQDASDLVTRIIELWLQR